MEFSNHCHRRAMTKDDSNSLDSSGFQSLLSSPIWHGGMVTPISKLNTQIADSHLAHHHHSESTPALRCVPVSSQWFLDRNATYASFSFHPDIQDLFETPCIQDSFITTTHGFPGSAHDPLALISSQISHLNGTSLSFIEEASDRHSVSHDVLFSTVCISDYPDRVPLYPISGHILFDTLSEESLKDNQILSMIGKDDSGQIQSDDASRDESAQISRNGGLVALATSPEKGMFYFFTYERLIR